MDKENIKKIISETLSSEEFMNGLVKQIQSQIKKEQEKVNEKAIDSKILSNFNPKEIKITKKPTKEELESHKKAQDMGKNVKTHTKFMNMFQNCTTNLDNITFSGPNNLNPNKMSPVLPALNLTPLYFMPKVTTIDDERICDIYTKFPEKISDINHADMGNNIKRLNSLLVANIENWHNWYFDELCDRNIPNSGISENLSAYFYEFLENESISIKDDSINSYIYIDFDDILKKMTIYIINYNNLNHKIYDFYKWIFALKDNASDEDLYNYFLNVNIQFPYDDYITEHIGKYIITYQDKTIYSTKNIVTENLKDIILSIIKSHNVNSYNTKAFNFFKKWSDIDKVDDILANNKEGNKKDDLKDDLDILKEYSKQSSENINISSSDNTLNVEINSSKDKIDKIKLLLHLALDGFIKINYNNGKILLDIDGNFVYIDNPYWE